MKLVCRCICWLIAVHFLCPRGPEENARLAEEVYQHLNAHKADNPSMGEVRKYENNHLQQFVLCCKDRTLMRHGELVLQLFTLTGCEYFCGLEGFISWSFLFSCFAGFFSFAPLLFRLSRHFLAPKVGYIRHVLLFSLSLPTQLKHNIMLQGFCILLNSFTLCMTMLVCSIAASCCIILTNQKIKGNVNLTAWPLTKCYSVKNKNIGQCAHLFFIT